MPTVNFNGNEQIVVDAQVFPGSSGSPVFAAFKGSFKMIGVVSQTMVRYGELSTLPADHSGLTVPQMMGLGIIIKSTAVQTLIDQVAIRVAEMNHGLERFKTLKKGLGQNAKRVL